MNQILDSNFHESYAEIESAIKSANFIAIDAEFTGIYSEEDVTFSYFDSMTDRYSTLKKNIERFAIIQFGIALFKHESNNNAYVSQCYNFYLFPRAGPFKNMQLSWQVAALEFLSRYKFDFNKFINTGISYLNEEDERLLRDQIRCPDFIQSVGHMSYDEELLFKDCLDKVSDWLEHGLDQVSFKLEAPTPIIQYMLHKEIRNNHKNVWTTSGYKAIDVIRVTDDVRTFLQSEENGRTEEELLQCYIGFSTVFKLLTSCKKPLIGHNVLLDLMFMHQQFYKPLPDDYSEFKTNINKLFPEIYDTKHLSFKLQNMLGKDEVNWKINTLPTLYQYFTSERGQYISAFSPNVYLYADKAQYEEGYHSAAWDSYYAGYIFIKMAHIFSVQKFGSGLREKHITNSELMSSVKEFKNCVNITRGTELFMQLGGADPTSSRPEWLHFRLKSPNADAKQLAEQLSSFCALDIKQFSRRGVLVAVSTRRSAIQILRHFQNSSEFQVTKYNRLRHGPPRTICLWGGLIVTGGCLFALIVRKMFLN